MEKINCDVSNCSHNKNGMCYSNAIEIGGINASTDTSTCCGSFLNKSSYGELTSNTNSFNQCDSLVCNVKTCKHNLNSSCNLHSISVAGTNSQVYTETKCASFKANS